MHYLPRNSADLLLGWRVQRGLSADPHKAGLKLRCAIRTQDKQTWPTLATRKHRPSAECDIWHNPTIEWILSPWGHALIRNCLVDFASARVHNWLFHRFQIHQTSSTKTNMHILLCMSRLFQGYMLKFLSWLQRTKLAIVLRTPSGWMPAMGPDAQVSMRQALWHLWSLLKAWCEHGDLECKLMLIPRLGLICRKWPIYVAYRCHVVAIEMALCEETERDLERRLRKRDRLAETITVIKRPPESLL